MKSVLSFCMIGVFILIVISIILSVNMHIERLQIELRIANYNATTYREALMDCSNHNNKTIKKKYKIK